MKLDCKRCGRSYSVPGVPPDRGFTKKCESCGHLIVVKPSTGDYIDLSFDEHPEPPAVARPLFEQPLGDKAVAAALEAAMGTSQPEKAPTDLTEELVPLHVPEAAPEDVEVVVDAEPVPEQQAPSVPPPVVGAPSDSDSAAVKKGGMPKVVLFGGALAVIVAGVLVVATRNKGPPAPAPSAAKSAPAPEPQALPLSGLAPDLRVKPALAAPDQRYVPPPSPKPYVPPPEPAASGKRRATQAGSQPRPAAAREAEAARPKAAAAPAAAAPIAETQRPRQLESSQVARVVAARRASFNACLAEAAHRDPSLEQGGRTMTMLLTVNPSGSVASSVLDDAQLAQTPLAACLSSAARLMVFPPFQGEPLQVRVPLAFSGRK